MTGRVLFLAILSMPVVLTHLPISPAEEIQAQAHPADVQALLDEVEDNLSDVETLSVDFVQERHLSIMNDILRAEGTLLFTRPSGVRLEIRSPFRSIIVASDKSVVRYEMLDGKWRRLTSGDARAVTTVTDQISRWIRGRLRESGNAFTLSAVLEPNTEIILTPRDERLRKYIEAIRLVLNDQRNALKALRVNEPGGDYVVMTFFREKRNVALDGALFDAALETPVDLPSSEQTEEGKTDE